MAEQAEGGAHDLLARSSLKAARRAMPMLHSTTAPRKKVCSTMWASRAHR